MSDVIAEPVDERSEATDLRPWATALAWPSDRLALSLLALLTLVLGVWMRLGGTLTGQDSATQFYPWYAYLGERLRGFDLPAWNPSQFSGAPFAGDPQSGWSYLPAMVFFTLLPVGAAALAHLVFHLSIAGFGTYAFSRALGIAPIGALTAGIIYELSGPVFARNICCPAQAQVTSWIPILLLGAQLLVTRRSAMGRFAGIAIASLALSQIVASWIGQGAYYAAMVLAAFLFYRTFVDGTDRLPTWRGRAALCFGGGLLIALAGFGLAAAGILPRLAYNPLTNLAGGVYRDDSARLGGWTAGSGALSQMTEKLYYPGGIAVALGLVAVVLTRRRNATPFFLGLILASLILGSSRETPLHRILYACLPRFRELHQHWPERLAIVVFIGVAVLAGAAVAALPEWVGRTRAMALMALVPLAVLGVFAGMAWNSGSDALPNVILLGVGIAVTALLLVGADHATRIWLAIPIVLTLAILLDFSHAARTMVNHAPYGGFHRLDLDSYYAQSGAAAAIDAAADEEPVRYFGYDAFRYMPERGEMVLYRYQFYDPITAALEVNNRATIVGLEDIQGYNPVQYRPYVEFMDALNGHDQDYHDANVFPSGLPSPLLDVLNVRFVIVPAEEREGQVELADLVATYPTIYVDDQVRVLERTSAMPRAWVVHEVREAGPATARILLAGGDVDPAQVALLEGPLPNVQPLPAGGADRVTWLQHEPERIVLEVEAASDGVLLLSEIDYPGWVATIDGADVPIRDADGVIRAIPVPAGIHRIEFRYPATIERRGLAISFGTVVFMLGTWFVLRRRREDERHPGGRERTRIPG